MKKIFPLFLLLCFLQSITAMPAYPYKVSVEIEGELYYIYLYGDEYQKWAETEDGYTLVQNVNNEWCYAVKLADDNLVASDLHLNSNQNEINLFKASTVKHLSPVLQSQAKVTNTRQSSSKVLGERRILVILMEYADLKFQKTNEDFNQLFNQPDYRADGARGSVRDFYEAASYGQLLLTCDIYGPYTTSKQMSYYGTNGASGGDINAYALFTEAIEHVANETDLKLYDGDGDGYLDNVHIIYAGYGEEAGGPASAIWAHESTFGRPYSINNVLIDKYSCAPELRGNKGNGISRIGPHCHEIGHALGAMDYYDTDYTTGGQYAGTGEWDVMAQGSWNNDGITPADFNPYVKSHDYGWVLPTPLPHGDVSIAPSNMSADNYYRLSSDYSGDYYLLENRSREGWGAGTPGSGLLIFHIHQDLQASKNKINASHPQKCYIVCASSKYQRPAENAASYGDINSGGCPYPGISQNSTFGESSTPQAFYWDSKACGIELNSIRMDVNNNIKLINNSYGADYQPNESARLFHEGFENSPILKVGKSSNGVWTLVGNPSSDNNLVRRPRAHDGQYCLQLSSKGNYYSNAESIFEISFNSESTDENIAVSLFYTSFGLSGKMANILRIGYEAEDESWVMSEILSSSNITWNSFTVNIPKRKSNRIRIEGTAMHGTVLAIDDIEVTQKITPTNNVGVAIQNSSIVSVYSLYGAKRTTVERGVNILLDSNNKTSRKIIVK